MFCGVDMSNERIAGRILGGEGGGCQIAFGWLGEVAEVSGGGDEVGDSVKL